MTTHLFPRPWRVEVNPFGRANGDEDNIFVVDATGLTVCVLGKHPVWKHLTNEVRLIAAHEIVTAINSQSPT